MQFKETQNYNRSSSVYIHYYMVDLGEHILVLIIFLKNQELIKYQIFNNI